MNEEVNKLAQELVKICKRAYNIGIQTGSGGNASARIPGKELMLVKASGSSFGDENIENYIITDFDGNLVEGKGKPTREALLHGFLYKICPNVNAVFHSHSPYSVAWASTHNTLPRVTWHSKLKISSDLPILDVKAAMVRNEELPLVEEIFSIDPNLPGFLLVDHGIVAVGNNPTNAEHTAELIEETAKIALLKGIVNKLEI